MKRDDFLFEIRTEEIPAAALPGARDDLARGIGDALSEEGLAAESVESFATPRRLVVWARSVPDHQPDRETEVLGPPASAAFDPAGRPTLDAHYAGRRHGLRLRHPAPETLARLADVSRRPG